MSDTRWEQIKEIFQSALDIPAGAERERHLDEACGGDTAMRAEVLEMLASFASADDFLDGSPMAEVAEAIVGTRETLVAGQEFGRYLIERKLGAGGMGEVFLAEDTELKRPVALKILSTTFSDNADRVRRFVQEARAASALNHPNILTIYEIGQVGEVRFIATEYVEGVTLRERYREARPLPVSEIVDIFTQTAAALTAAHSAGIVHRDIKPENIMVRGDGLVKVLDFGLAKLLENEGRNESVYLTDTTPGLVMGTVAYMSPEQARGLATDTRTDIWSLGVCLSEIVFGVHPFAGNTASDRIAAILKSEPQFGKESAAPALRSIIEKCLAKNADERYRSVQDLAGDLKTFSGERDVLFPQTNVIKNDGDTSEVRNTTGAHITGTLVRRPGLSVATATLVIVAVASIAYLLFAYGFSHSGTINSIAVLSFVNETGDENSEYLSDGLSESLINQLSQIPQLRVASRSSAFRYKGQDIDPSQAARALGVQAVVTGRVVRRGDDLQIGVELINAVDNSQIWGETYRRKITDAQAIQEDIAQAVLQKLRLKLSGAEKKRFNAQITDSSQAYQHFLNGVFFRRKNGTENLNKAIEYQNQAIALDPEFAMAYAELGNCYYTLTGNNFIDPQIGIPLTRQAIEKALSLDYSLAEARDINADLKRADFDWVGAEEEFQRASELNPNLASAHTGYATLLSDLGRFDEAIREIRRAQELDPLRVNLVNNEGTILIHARRYDDALATLDRAAPESQEETYALIDRARIYIAKVRYNEAFAVLNRSLSEGNTVYGLVILGRAHALSGKRDEALRILERLKTSEEYVSPCEIAILHAALGQTDEAFAAIEKGIATRDLQVSQLATAPEYDSLRDDPRFGESLRRIKLTASTLPR